MATLAINSDTLVELKGQQTWEQFAEEIGIDQGSLSRVRHGKSAPGPRFIAAMLIAKPVRFEDLCVIVDDHAGDPPGNSD